MDLLDKFKIGSEFNEVAFNKIAKRMFHEYAIQTHESTYRLTEIEFYWSSVEHLDKSTYERKYVDPKTGEWFFHYSGVDIALRSESGYGGILIRGIQDINNMKPFKGPMVCAMKLFSGTNAFNDTIKTKIIPHRFSKTEIFKSERKGLGNNAKENNADKLLYRYYIKPIVKIDNT